MFERFVKKKKEFFFCDEIAKIKEEKKQQSGNKSREFDLNVEKEQFLVHIYLDRNILRHSILHCKS